MSKIRCSCGNRIGADPVLPSEVWERIARDDYALCWDCVDDRCAALGIRCDVDAFYSGAAVKTKHPAEVGLAVRAWRHSQHCVERSGRVGNPLLYNTDTNDGN